jgi:hypothetical protein
MTKEEDVKKLLEKVDRVTKEKKLDLSSDEDLSIGIMNLIGIEEHLFFTAEKTGKKEYYELLKEVREMRKDLLKKIIKEYEGEVWCISKHLLAGSMRLMEVGTKSLGKGDDKEAYEFFDKAYKLYSLFWALNLKLINTDTFKDKKIISKEEIERLRKEEKNGDIKSINSKDLDLKEDKSFFSKIGDALKKAIDCCKE